jgi:hypothetical protein
VGNTVPANSDLPQAKEFSLKLSAILAQALKNVRQTRFR